MGRLGGRIALVAGCAQGIGAGVARVTVKEGPKLVLADVNVDGAEPVAALTAQFADRTNLQNGTA